MTFSSFIIIFVMGMRICNENESISSIKRSGRAHDKDCNKKRKRHPIHSCDNFKIAKRTQSDTAFIRSEDKDCWENGKESKINQFSWQSWDCTYAYSIFSLTQYLHENMCIAIKCYLLENVIFIFYFFYLFFLSFYFQFLFPFSLSLLCLLCFFPSSSLPLSLMDTKKFIFLKLLNLTGS